LQHCNLLWVEKLLAPKVLVVNGHLFMVIYSLYSLAMSSCTRVPFDFQLAADIMLVENFR